MKIENTTLLNGLVKLNQTHGGLRASMDSVLLACAVQVKAGESLLDMGCGTGAVGLCISARFPNMNLALTGMDIQDHMVAMACDNAALNGIDATYICGDVHDKSHFNAESYDHVVMNPPYYAEGKRLQSPDSSREKAYSGDLEKWMASALYWVRHGGTVTMIHRADALNDILYFAQKKFGAIEIWPIHSKPDEPAIRVIVKMVRNRKTPLTLHPPVVMFDADGQPSARSNALLRDGQGLMNNCHSERSEES